VSLKAFHVAFIVASILLSGWVAWWAAGRAAAEGGGWWWLAGGGAAAAVGLVVYGAWFLRKTRGMSYL
jgi:hypothetical protein